MISLGVPLSIVKVRQCSTMHVAASRFDNSDRFTLRFHSTGTEERRFTILFDRQTRIIMSN